MTGSASMFGVLKKHKDLSGSFLDKMAGFR